MPEKILISWSSGKESAWLLHVLRQDPRWEPVGLLTTVAADSGRVTVHGVRRELLEIQADAAGLPLQVVELPQPCPNDVYEARLAPIWTHARVDGVTAVAFGDLFLADIRAFRERQLAGTGLTPVFPLWGRPTGDLARRMVAAGLRAIITCVDTRQLAPEFLGRTFDAELLQDLPEGVDPCAEHGEFHTFATAGPMFDRSLATRMGARTTDAGFARIDLRGRPPAVV